MLLIQEGDLFVVILNDLFFSLVGFVLGILVYRLFFCKEKL